MGKKKNAAKNNSVQQSEKPVREKSPKANGVKKSRPVSKRAPQSSGSVRWAGIVLVSVAVAAVAVLFSSPDARTAVNEMITKLTTIEHDPVIHETIHEPKTETFSEENVKQENVEQKKEKLKQENVEQEKEKLKQENVEQKKENVEQENVEQKKEKLKHEDVEQKRENVKQEKVEQRTENGKQEKTEKGMTQNKDKLETEAEQQKDAMKDVPPSNQERKSKGETKREEKKMAERQNDEPARGSSKTERQQEGDSYAKSDITNTADHKIRDALDKINATLEKGEASSALAQYNKLLEDHPSSPRALYGRAQALDELSEEQKSNKVLGQALDAYTNLLKAPDVPDQLYKEAGFRLAERQRFRGLSGKAAKTLEMMVERLPQDIALKNQLGLGYLYAGNNDKSKEVFKQVLKESPRNGFAMVHLGFILKTSDNNPVEAIPYLEKGLLTQEAGTQDGRFYHHLGDALQRVGNKEKAYKIFNEAVEKGFLLSVYQRSLYNVDSLQSKPWWTMKETGVEKELKMLGNKWKEIRDEAMTLIDAKTQMFRMESENLSEAGVWKSFTLFAQGHKFRDNCQKTPVTCALVEKIPQATGNKRGQVKFSLMEPGVHVWPHTGPTNCRIRAHLGLITPPGPRIRVANETKTWKEGEFLIFDDSFEHEVWHDGSETRLVLIVDVWHPDLTARERRELPAI